MKSEQPANSRPQGLMTRPFSLLIAILLMLLAGTLRFSKLGDWPFAGDETATLVEAHSLFHPDDPSIDSDNHIDCLYHSAGIHALQAGIEFFGDDEFGDRRRGVSGNADRWGCL
ncbi:MAG: hypothetical protein R3C53_27305 [Pirellulaceae bacterium]